MPYSLPLTWRKIPLTVRPQTQQLAGWAARGGPRGGAPVPGFVTGAPTERKPPTAGVPSLVWGAETGLTPPVAPPPDWKPWTKEPKTVGHYWTCWTKKWDGFEVLRAPPPPALLQGGFRSNVLRRYFCQTSFLCKVRKSSKTKIKSFATQTKN